MFLKSIPLSLFFLALWHFCTERQILEDQTSWFYKALPAFKGKLSVFVLVFISIHFSPFPLLCAKISCQNITLQKQSSSRPPRILNVNNIIEMWQGVPVSFGCITHCWSVFRSLYTMCAALQPENAEELYVSKRL